MNLPNDPNILLSVLNMKLRDQYASLSALCEDLDISEEALGERLSAAGLLYEPGTNQVKFR